MRIVKGFLVILVCTILLLLPIIPAIDDFKSDPREDNFFIATGGGVTTANITLAKPLYNNDTAKLEYLLSSNSQDVPVLVTYDIPTHSILINGLIASANRTITIDYDTPAYVVTGGLTLLANNLWGLWIILILSFIPTVLVAILLHK